MKKEINWIFAVLALCGALFLYYLKPTKQEREVREALESCLDDIENNCKGLYEYALTLEVENARIRKQLENARNNCR